MSSAQNVSAEGPGITPRVVCLHFRRPAAFAPDGIDHDATSFGIANKTRIMDRRYFSSQDGP
jgi:hypothetical protein